MLLTKLRPGCDDGAMKTRKMKRLCVYCGPGPAKTRALWRSGGPRPGDGRGWIGLVYGGGGNGLMGTVAQTVRDHGGHVTGIIPASLLEVENALETINSAS